MSSLDQQAAESLAYIRHTMARSASFTAVPGKGGAVMGVIAVIAAVVASRQTEGTTWLGVWLLAAAVAIPIGLWSMLAKAKTHGVALLSPAGRRFAQGFLPAIVAAAIMTALLARAERVDLLPPMWLLLYGAGVMAGGSASVPVLAWTGAAFIGCGIGAGLSPAGWGDLWLGLGFGGAHIGFGLTIARKYGG